MTHSNPVAVIGGGWAGLAAAMELSASGVDVTLYESAPLLGGRARNAPFGNLTVDNGQHLMIGAYNEILRLLAVTGISEDQVVQRRRLRLKVAEGEEQLIMQAPPLPAPLHLAWAQLTSQGISTKERLLALLMSLRLMMSKFTLPQDISVESLLQNHRQSERMIRRFWEPLCMATLNTPIARASAQVFLRVLKDSFTHRRQDADLLLPKVPLGDLFPLHAADYLKQQGATIHTRHRITGLQINEQRLEALELAGKTLCYSDAVIATAPKAAARLMKHPSLLPLRQQISELGEQPICTVYLQYPSDHRLDEPMLGMSGTVSQWLFDRSVCQQPGLIAVVVSAEGPHEHWDNDSLAEHVSRELREQFPQWPQPLRHRVIRERRATFDCQVGVESRRPGNTTPVQGLWLAGDYTDTGYPATLEGAVRSGVECARQILAKRH